MKRKSQFTANTSKNNNQQKGNKDSLLLKDEEEETISSFPEIHLSDEENEVSESYCSDFGEDATTINFEEDEEEEEDNEHGDDKQQIINKLEELYWEKYTENKNMDDKHGKPIKSNIDKLPDIDPVYESDTSDEDHENTVGNIPMKWYEEYDHIGYTRDGEKITKQATRDEVDKFLENTDNPDIWRSVFDEMAGKNVKLTKEDLQIINKIQNQQLPDEINPYEDWIEFFSHETEVMPLSSAPEPKRRFIPSKNEAKRIMKIARAIRKGWIKPKDEANKLNENDTPTVYDIWGELHDVTNDIMHIPAPKMSLPGNEESYNPPAEYLKTEEEIAEEEKWKDGPIFIPKKFSSLRLVPAYERFINERFDRCLDLYLCPRAIKKRIQVDPESLLPKLPDPKDLEPFPSKLSIVYEGHEDKVLGISVDPKGFWMASISQDKSLRIWEVSTGRCARVYKFEHVPRFVSWNPNKEVHMLSVAIENEVIIISPKIENKVIIENTEEVLSNEGKSKNKSASQWKTPNSKQYEQGYRMMIECMKPISYINWHKKGDYFATISHHGTNSGVLIHQISRQESQQPFSRSKGLITSVVFHPNKPFFFVATQRNVRVYNLLKQEMVKKLISGVKWISSMDVHPSGDHVIIGSFDKRLCWFDLDLSSTAYKTLRYNQRAVRSVSFHKKYPLFASCSDDGSINVFHSMVYNDMMQNPLIVPLKKIKAHQETDGLGCVSVTFHPNQPWMFSCGVDGMIKLFT